jgi:hypothetical protein
VVRLGRETDRETREFVVDLRVEELPPNWTVGQRAEVYIETGRRRCCSRAAGFCGVAGRAPGVFVEEGGEARERAVGLGRPDAGISRSRRVWSRASGCAPATARPSRSKTGTGADGGAR